MHTCRCSRRPPTDSKLIPHLSQRQLPLSVACDLPFSGARAGNRIVVGAESIGDNDGLDSLLLESSSSSSTSSSSTGVAWVSSTLLFSDGDNLEMGSWPWDLSAPRIPPQPFIRLLFSFTCDLDRIQPLKSSGIGSPSSDGVAVEGGELHLAVLRLVSEVNLPQNLGELRTTKRKQF